MKKGAMFCWECGAKAASPERRCQKCGAEIADGEKYCSACGEKIQMKFENGRLSGDRERFSDTRGGDGSGRGAGEGLQFEYHREEESHENMSRLARFLKVCEVSEQFDWERAGRPPAQNMTGKATENPAGNPTETEDDPVSLFLQISLVGIGITVLTSLASLILHKMLPLYLSFFQIICLVAAVLLNEDAIRSPKKWIQKIVLAGSLLLSVPIILLLCV